MSEERLFILRKIESGEISIEEGQRLIDALDGRSEETFIGENALNLVEKAGEEPLIEPPVVVETGQEKERPIDFARWRAWGWVVFGIFVVLTVLSAVWMILGWQTHPWGWGFWLSWIPFLIGVAGMAATYRSRWLHVRIRQAPGQTPEKISISLPLPMGLTSWIMVTFSRWIPQQVREQNIHEMLVDIDRNIKKDEPLHIQVEGEDGERVEVFIG